MKILIIHRYFYPDTSTYAFLLAKLANSYKNYFEEVDVLTTMPSYYGSEALKAKANEKVDNVSIKRLKLFKEKGRELSIRIINSLLFTFYVFFNLLLKGGKYNYVQVATTPPVLVALAVALASKIRGFKVVYHCQDIYPEIIYFNGKPNKIKDLVLSVLKALDVFIMKSANKIVVLSEDMKTLLIQKRNIKADKIYVINNFIFERKEKKNENHEIPDSIKEVLKEGKKIMVFAGNLGTFQNLDLLFEIVENVLKKTESVFLVIGEGVNKQSLQNKFKNENIHFVGYLQNELLQLIYPKCKIGFAPVIQDIEKVAFPSKIISYLVSGVPVITFSSKDSEISNLIESNTFGLNYSFNDKKYLEEIIVKGLNTEFDTKNIKDKAFTIFGEELAFKKWEQLYNEK